MSNRGFGELQQWWRELISAPGTTESETLRLRRLGAWDQEHRDAYLSLAQLGLRPDEMTAAGMHWMRASCGLPDPCPTERL